MNHAITIGGLLSAVLVFVGLIVTGIGLLTVFAGGMSDAPDVGARTTNNGCLVTIVGLIMLVGGILGLFR